jgi:hypothetical protein
MNIISLGSNTQLASGCEKVGFRHPGRAGIGYPLHVRGGRTLLPPQAQAIVPRRIELSNPL